jgi:hypothetical protein
MTVLAHGGAVGLVAEILVAVTVLGLFAAVWLRERRARLSRSDDEP